MDSTCAENRDTMTMIKMPIRKIFLLKLVLIVSTFSLIPTIGQCRVFEKKKIHIVEHCIGKTADFIITMTDPEGNNIKKELLTIDTKLNPEFNKVSLKMSTGNPEKEEGRRIPTSYPEYMIENTPLRFCPVLIIYPSGTKLVNLRQKSFNVTQKYKSAEELEKNNLILELSIRNCNLKLTPFGNPILTPH